MLDRQMEMMLQVAATLTAEDLDTLRSTTLPGATTAVEKAQGGSAEIAGPSAVLEPSADVEAVGDPTCSQPPAAKRRVSHAVRNGSTAPATAGEYERQRTRESKVSTECLGREREKHDWWPVGTQLVGWVGLETFTALVVANPQVKSGRSIQITSGPATGKVGLTPTRAAIEATEAYRQANKLGRAGGITNGWTFWKPKA